MVIRPEDVSLAEELAEHFRLSVNEQLSIVEQWARLVAQLREAGYEIRKANDASAGPDFAAAYRRAQPKIAEVFRRLAPPGTPVTPALVAKAQAEVIGVVVGELRAMGMGETEAGAAASLLYAATRVTEKKAR